MKRYSFILFLVLTQVSSNLKAQDYFIGDTLKSIQDKNDYFKTNAIVEPYVIIFESNFILKVNRNDLVKILSSDYANLNIQNDIKANLKSTINYITFSDSLVFKNLWSHWDNKDDEMKEDENRKMTKTIIREWICELIDQGKFQLIVNNEIVEWYYFKRVNSNYGGNVNGAFSRNNILFWICPPFIMD